MRFMLKVSMDVDCANNAVKEGRLGPTIESILKDLNPESAYFTTDGGRRTGFLFIKLDDASQIPQIAEPWFLAFNADIELRPVMVPADLKKAGPHFEESTRKYGDLVRAM
jgi:hypothetical protein